MTPQEQDVIAGIFDRLKQAAAQPRDPEAERLIAQRIAEQPYAPYAMAQMIYVQEQALTNLQQQLDAANARLQQAQAAASSTGSFLGGIFGGRPADQAPAPSRPSALPPGVGAAPSAAWGQSQGMAPSAPPPAYGAAPAGPWGGAQAAGGGGFLRSALTTAAGVAGGMMLGNVLTNAFTGHGGGAAHAAASNPSGLTDPSLAAATPLSDGAQPEQGSFPTSDPMQGDSYESASQDMDGGSDFGGGDDGWA